MLLVCGYYRGDVDQAVRLATRLAELGGLGGHSMLVARDRGTQERPFAILEGLLDRIEEIEITDSPQREWPYPANNVFQKCAKHVYYTTQEPFLWLEPDCWPMSPGCLATIVGEYQTALAAGKSFLGDFVSVHTAELDVPDHMSGIGIYPGNLVDLDQNGNIMLCDSIAWDVSGADVILPRMYRSEVIHHSWKHKAFVDKEQVQREIYEFKPKCVLFHADKTGSLAQVLGTGREEAKPAEPEVLLLSSEPVSPVPFGDFAGSNPAPCGPDGPTDILIKSYPQDYPLLEYCLKSLAKFASGFRQIIVIYPEGEPPNLWDNGDPHYKGIPVRENGDGYMVQMVLKTNAHEFTDAKYILHTDSDTFFTRPITPETFFRDGKPFWLIAPYSKIEVPWQASTEKFLGEPVEYETMRRMPMFVPRAIHVATAAFCLMKHGMTVRDYIMSQPTREFSEFNCMGALAYSRAHEDFTWLNTHAE